MERIDRYRQAIAQALTEAASREGPLAVLLRYPLGLSEPDGTPGPGVGGKLLRPSLCLLACEALGGSVEAALPLATSVELVHVFSLVHDDIQDGDEYRRGRRSAWAVFGVGPALNAGDGLLSLAVKTAARAPLPPPLVVQAIECLAEATLRMIEGQTLDLAMEGKRVGTKEWTEMALRKTGALFGGALELGALAAGRPEWGEAHRKLGEELGLAFQIQDDALALWGDEQRLGKPVGNDLARGKRSFPIAWALERDPTAVAVLQSGDLAAARATLTALGAYHASQQAALNQWNKVEAMVRALPWAPWAQAEFTALLSAVKEREA